MRHILLIVFAVCSISMVSQAQYFEEWECVEIPGHLKSEIYYSDGKLSTLQEGGIYISDDLGKNWQLENEILAWNFISSKVVRRTDGLYIFTSRESFQGPNGTSKIISRVDENGNLIGTTSVLQTGTTHSVYSLNSFEYAFNGGAAFNMQRSVSFSPVTYNYVFYDGQDHYNIDAFDRPGIFVAKLNPFHLWRSGNTYQLYDDVYEIELAHHSAQDSNHSLVLQGANSYLFNADASYSILNAPDLSVSTGQLPLNSLDSVWMTSAGQFQIASEDYIYEWDATTDPALKTLKVPNPDTDIEIEIVEATADWLLGKNEDGALAHSFDLGANWELFFPNGLDHIVDIERDEDVYMVKNLDENWTSDCLESFEHDMDYKGTSEIILEVGSRIFKLEEKTIFYSDDQGENFIELFTSPYTYPPTDLIHVGSAIYCLGVRLYKINVETLDYSDLGFGAYHVQLVDNVLYLIYDRTLAKLYPDGNIIEIYDPSTTILDFYIDGNEFQIFGVSDYFLSEDAGVTFEKYPYGEEDPFFTVKVRIRDIIISRGRDAGCDALPVVSFDKGKSWQPFSVPDVHYLPKSYTPWKCDDPIPTDTSPKYGFRTDETYLYALGGVHGLYKTLLFDASENPASADSLIAVCYGDSVLVDGSWITESTLMPLSTIDVNGCLKLKTVAIEFWEQPTTEFIDLELMVGDTFLNTVILEDVTLEEIVLDANGCEQSIFYNIAAIISSISEADLIANQLTIYPNPVTSDVLYFDIPTWLNNCMGTIFNSSGHSFSVTKIEKAPNGYSISVEDLSPGLYWIQIENERQHFFGKFLIVD